MVFNIDDSHGRDGKLAVGGAEKGEGTRPLAW